MSSRRGLTRLTKITALTGAGIVLAASAATAHVGTVEDGTVDSGKATHSHDLQHGADSGHLPAVSTGGLRKVSELALKNAEPGKIADVGVHKGYAYLAAWGGETCRYNGVHVVDLADVAAPREVGFINSKEGSYPGEGVQALSISTPAFTGDVLVTNNEKCKDGVGFGGINIYDITKPTAPTPLAVGFGDESASGEGKKPAHETHSVFAWQAGDKAYAVMVDNDEATDIDIVDISDPKAPVLVKEYDLSSYTDAQGRKVRLEAGLDEVFLHDMVVEKRGTQFVMLASYWDAGYVQLDVTNPLNALVLSDSQVGTVDPEGVESRLKTPAGLPVPPEGNAHQAEYAGTMGQYVLGADEDFSPYASLAKNVTDDTKLTVGQGSDTTKLAVGTRLSGPTVFVGRACTGDPAVPPGAAGRIAVVERGLCTFNEKIANVIRAGGYAGVLVFNRTGSDACNDASGMSVSGAIPTFGVAPRQQGLALFGREGSYDDAACLAEVNAVQADIALGAVGDVVDFQSYFDGWGYVRLLNTKDLSEADTYAIPEAHDPAFATGAGDLSVHEIATSAVNKNRAYVSYYSGGVRVLEISRGKLVEKAAFIAEGGSNFWGVQVFSSGGKEYVAASDRDKGLYVFEYAP